MQSDNSYTISWKLQLTDVVRVFQSTQIIQQSMRLLFSSSPITNHGQRKSCSIQCCTSELEAVLPMYSFKMQHEWQCDSVMGCIDATTENSEFAIYKHKNEDAILPDLLAEASTASQFCQEQSLSLFFF